jgi:signal recognition particle subunit SRP68
VSSFKFEFIRSLTKRRCVNIAQSHILLSNIENALALLLRAQSLIETAQSTLSKSSSSAEGPLKLDISQSSLKAAQEAVESRTHQYHGLVAMQKLSEAPEAGKTGRVKSVPIIDRLNTYSVQNVELSNLVTYPPKLQPVPVKPLFFDLAWNYIDYPGRVAAPAVAKSEGVSEEKKPAKKGWFGFGR